MISGVTERLRTGHGNIYITINRDEENRPFEVFGNLGKAGGCDAAQMEAVSRMVSLALRARIDPEAIIEQLQGITCCPAWYGGVNIRSSPDAVALALRRHMDGRQDGKRPAPLEDGIQMAMLSGGEPSAGGPPELPARNAPTATGRSYSRRDASAAPAAAGTSASKPPAGGSPSGGGTNGTRERGAAGAESRRPLTSSANRPPRNRGASQGPEPENAERALEGSRAEGQRTAGGGGRRTNFPSACQTGADPGGRKK